MKKLLLVFLLVFSFATLSAGSMMKFQDARNYCSDLGGRLPTVNEVIAGANTNKMRNQPCKTADYITVDGSHVYVTSTCEVMSTGRARSYEVYDVLCVK